MFLSRIFFLDPNWYDLIKRRSGALSCHTKTRMGHSIYVPTHTLLNGRKKKDVPKPANSIKMLIPAHFVSVLHVPSLAVSCPLRFIYPHRCPFLPFSKRYHNEPSWCGRSLLIEFPSSRAKGAATRRDKAKEIRQQSIHVGKTVNLDAVHIVVVGDARRQRLTLTTTPRHSGYDNTRKEGERRDRAKGIPERMEVVVISFGLRPMFGVTCRPRAYRHCTEFPDRETLPASQVPFSFTCLLSSFPPSFPPFPPRLCFTVTLCCYVPADAPTLSLCYASKTRKRYPHSCMWRVISWKICC